MAARRRPRSNRPRHELRRAARVDNGLIYLTVTTSGGAGFARRIAQARADVREVCEMCGRPGAPRTRSGSVLCDVHWHPLTTAEKAFALSAGIPEAWFGVEAELANEVYVARGQLRDRELSAAHLSERDMADMLNVSVRRVHEMFEQERLAGADWDGRIVYPRWQVTDDGRLLPGLAAVIHAAEDLDPQTLQAIMENAEEELDGLSPARWLAGGGAIEPVLKSVAESWLT